MAYENLCMYCFKDLNGESVCPHCGGDSRAAVPQIQMLPGTLVYRDRFLVGRALGQDSSGVVYNALDTKRGGVIRIREYLPRNCAERTNDGSVVPIAGMEEAFETGMRKLRASVDSVEDPKKRHFYFEENGTAYIAQRKGAAAAVPGESESPVEEEDSGRRQIIVYIVVAAAIVLAVAIGLILFFNSLGSTNDRTRDNPLASPSPDATWSPDYTPTPTPHTTPTFAALVDPELSWMDYTYPGDVNSEYQQQQNASATQKPSVQGNQNYPTVNNNSSASDVRALQQHLVQLGWLSYNNVTGNYDAATKEAVRAFQHYVNEHCSPAEKLAEDGIAGKKTQQWLYNSSVSLSRPTPTPTPKVTAAPNADEVDKNSTPDEVRDLQNKLITLGLMPAGSADGRYGSATSTAVKNFQSRVNQLQGYTVLQPNGTADALTRAWLNYYVEEWKKLQSATATPAPASPTVTPSPAPDPTGTPSVTGTPAPTSGTVDASSSKEAIREVQTQLQQVGLLSASDVDGVYGSRTVEAVRKFQEWVNRLRGENTLEITGTVDTLTKLYLNYCVENGRVYDLPTQAPATTAPATNPPTFEPTEAPDTEPDPTEVPPNMQAGSSGVTPDSPTESIQFVQEMLSTIGLLDASQADGVYGSATAAAIRAFQEYVNETMGEQVLEVTGQCDPDTLGYLVQAYEEAWDLSRSEEPTPAPTIEPTPEPTQAATPEPTEVPTPEPTEAPAEDGVSPESSAEAITEMQRMLNSVGLLASEDVNGIYSANTEDAVRGLQRAVNAANGREILEVNGRCDAMTLEYLRYAYQNGFDLREFGSAVTPEPTEVPTPVPTEVPTPEPTEAPVVGKITAMHFALSGREVNGIVELTPGAHQITWGAEGDVKSYYVSLYDGNQNLLHSEADTTLTGLNVDTSSIIPGETYELRVGAMPVNGAEGDIFWSSLQLIYPVPVTPEPTPAPTAAPSVSAPVIRIGSAVYQQDGVEYISDSTAIFTWMAEGQVDHYSVSLTYQDGSNYKLSDATASTSQTVNVAQLQQNPGPGLYRLYVGATPVGGNADSTVWNELVFGIPAPAATATPEVQVTPEPSTPGDTRITYIDQNSRPEDIYAVQYALYSSGKFLTDSDSIQTGVLDLGTLQAVAAFQQWANATFGLELQVIDPLVDTFIDAQTLDLLLYQDLDFSA